MMKGKEKNEKKESKTDLPKVAQHGGLKKKERKGAHQKPKKKKQKPLKPGKCFCCLLC
jgi:hypothetical protein